MRALESRVVVVTGAGGFIGSAVTAALVERGASVRALLGPPDAEVAAVPEGVASWYGMIDDGAVLDELAAGAQVIVHLAGSPSVSASFRDSAECIRTHVVGTAAVVGAAQRAAVARLIYVSSAEIYGPNAPRPVAEGYLPEPVSPYAAAKLGAEAVIAAAVRASSLEATILRPFSVFGPGMASTSVVMSILRQAQNGDGVTLADLRPVRDYCYVDDVANAIVWSCAQPLPRPLCTYNIGTGVGTSVGDLAEKVFTSLGRTPRIREDPRRRRPADILTLVSDSSRARAVLGWRPRTSLSAGLELLVEAHAR
jgi:nucleoside-diphosphate-sugar epimerase